MQGLIRTVLTFHWLSTFVLMGLFSLLGALASVNIFMMLSANFRFLTEHGVLAVMEGAALQLGQLLLTGFFALAMYLGFKACERVLVEKLLAK
jgi:hypothetical protein